jgi:hypothetical protein
MSKQMDNTELVVSFTCTNEIPLARILMDLERHGIRHVEYRAVETAAAIIPFPVRLVVMRAERVAEEVEAMLGNTDTTADREPKPGTATGAIIQELRRAGPAGMRRRDLLMVAKYIGRSPNTVDPILHTLVRKKIAKRVSRGVVTLAEFAEPNGHATSD